MGPGKGEGRERDVQEDGMRRKGKEEGGTPKNFDPASSVRPLIYRHSSIAGRPA